jgi:ribonucleoside-diphosphate reductase alpha chain
MPDNDGYIKVAAVMQKFFDQAISGNWSYNPENYENGEVPVSVMAKDMLNTYKYGWKTSYYQNTMDGKTEDVVKDEPLPQGEIIDDGEDCDACAI